MDRGDKGRLLDRKCLQLTLLGPEPELLSRCGVGGHSSSGPGRRPTRPCFWTSAFEPALHLVPRTGRHSTPIRHSSRSPSSCGIFSPASPPRLPDSLESTWAWALGTTRGQQVSNWYSHQAVACAATKLRIYWINNGLRSPEPPSPACKSDLPAVGAGGGVLPSPRLSSRDASTARGPDERCDLSALQGAGGGCIP